MLATWDTISNSSSVSIANQLARFTRTGRIDDIPAGAASDPLVLIRGLGEIWDDVIKGVPIPGSAVCTDVIVTAGGTTNDARFTAHFVRPTLGFMNDPSMSMWLVEQDSSLQVESEELDLNGMPVQTIFTEDVTGYSDLPPDLSTLNKINSSNGKPTHVYGIHVAELPVLRPRETVSITGYTFGMSRAYVKQALGKVNAKEWSGYGVGFWLCTRASAKAENAMAINNNPRKQMYRVQAQFSSKVVRDWSHYAIHRQMNGKISPKMLGAQAAQLMKKLVYGTPYSTNQDHSLNGVVRAGMYNVADFKTIFNFDLDDYT